MATRDPALVLLDRLAGSWTTAATHPALPGVVVHGTAEVEWLEGGHFLVQRARNEHPDFPDSIAVIGFTGTDRVGDGPPADDATTMTMHYFDSRGVFRVYQAGADEQALRFWRDSPGFSQRFTGVVAGDGTSIDGRWELCRDDEHWDDDLHITYERRR